MPSPQQIKPAVFVISLGCPKNRVDTEAMLGTLDAGGYRVADRLEDAACVLINTCGFLGSAIEEAHEEIRAVLEHKARFGYRVVVTGCLVERQGQQILADFPQVDAVLGIHTYSDILRAVTGEQNGYITEAEPDYAAEFYTRRRLTTGPAWTYLRVADGCDNRCTYCTIPDIRGAYHSRPLEQIVEEARAMTDRGVREFNLIAQDTTRYGDDIYGARRLPDLLDALAAIDGVRWLRILYTHPAHFDDALINAMARHAKVLPYVDIPLQHIADPILAAMGRRVTKAQTVDLLARLRAAMPALVLRTTFIVGFPGEIEEHFQELLDFIAEMRFERAGAFRYSPEPGTPAARLTTQVPDEVKDERLDRLMRLQQEISLTHNRAQRGAVREVLVEGVPGRDVPQRRGYAYYGRSYADAPEIDGFVYLRTVRNQRLYAGQFVTARIEQGWEYDLGGMVE
jgi:ribosomal protein S12 methylthiotransferase